MKPALFKKIINKLKKKWGGGGESGNGIITAAFGIYISLYFNPIQIKGMKFDYIAAGRSKPNTGLYQSARKALVSPSHVSSCI